MDSRGWIPIPLISSFNRVRLLTVDPSLVREVLVLSTVVEVKDDWVRMSGWEQFVLPNSAKSEVEDFAFEGSSQAGTINADEVGEGEADGEEEEEEEVEFVMERGPDSPERRDV
jgi:la-related protein 1